MKSTSKVIMAATLVMVVCLAIVLVLILVLLADLYCSLFLRRRHRRRLSMTSSDESDNTATATGTSNMNNNTSSSSSQQPSLQNPCHDSLPDLSSYYAHGVLQAPRSFLFPALPCKANTAVDTKNHISQPHHVLDIHTPQQIGPPTNTSPPLPVNQTSAETPIQRSRSIAVTTDSACDGGGSEPLVIYISNPIYDANRVDMDTPFETPGSSPSRLEEAGSGGSSSEEDGEILQPSSHPMTTTTTPPLSPMKKLPAEACSVSLRDARSLGTSGSDSVSNNGISSSSSASPCTSPSW